MRRASVSANMAALLIRSALWFCAWIVAAGVLPGQCTNVSQVSNLNINSGTVCYSNNTTLPDSGVTVSGSASASFVAGQTVHLTPNFRATAGSAATTFHAWVETAPALISAFPSGGTGLGQQFTWTVSSPSGSTNIAHVYALFNTSLSGANGCYIDYDRLYGALYLASDAGTGWLGPVFPGSQGYQSNSYCTIYGSGSSVSTAGNQLAVTANLTFQSGTFSGAKYQYLQAIDNQGLYAGFQQVGAWTVAASGGFAPLRISPAGPYTDTQGNSWTSDYGYNPNTATWSTTAAITGTSDQRLYQTERWSDPAALSYQFAVPNGNYNVTLKFAEIYETAAGQRPMNIALNGITVRTNLDVWTAAGGRYKAYDVTFPVTVSFGQLTIVVTSMNSGHSAEVNAIQIVSTGIQYYLTTAVSPSGGGTISPASGSYNAGTQVSITAAANPGYQFAGSH